MMSGEVDDKVGHTYLRQLVGANRAVITIEAHSPGKGQVESDQDGRQCSTPQTEAGVSFPDVVEQSRQNVLARNISVLAYVGGRLIPMGLVTWVLFEECGGRFDPEPLADLGSLLLTEWFGACEIEEPADQMRQRARHELLVGQALAVDAENGFGPGFEAGLCDFLPAPVTFPVCTGFDMGQSGIDLVELLLE